MESPQIMESPQRMESLQTMESPHAMLNPAVPAWFHTAASPQTMELPITSLPQVMESLQTMELFQMLGEPVIDALLARLTCPLTGSTTAVGEAALPLATSVLPSAASTSRRPAPMVKASYCSK